MCDMEGPMVKHCDSKQVSTIVRWGGGGGVSHLASYCEKHINKERGRPFERTPSLKI